MKYLAMLLALFFLSAWPENATSARADDGGVPPLWHFRGGEDDAGQSFGINTTDRLALRDYLRQDGYCLRHYCLGISHYSPGTYLPASVVPESLPETVAARLATPPLGALYVRAQGGVYLVDRDSRLILDTVRMP